MEPEWSPSNGSRGVGAAPFAYGRRRQSVFGTSESVAEAARATQAVLRPVSSQSDRPRRQPRGVGRSGGAALDITTAIHQRARLSCLLDEDALRAAVAAGGRSASPSLSLTPGALSTSLPPLVVEAVPGCLQGLRYARSTRAWATLATGCVAEATQLSEVDNDVVAWAACFILSGDAQRGLLLLESYVVATCVVVYEVQIGALGCLPKGVNPFSRRKGAGGGAGANVRDDGANPYVQRKCLERHNQVLLAWMRHRTIAVEHQPAELANYDVNTARMTESAVRQVTLQAMQLIDAVEVQRWYIAALMFYTAAVDAGGGAGGADGASGDAAGRGVTRRRRGSETARSPVMGVGGDTDSVFAQTRSAHGNAGGADASTAAAATSASDDYRAPRNLWFRYFFALDDASAVSDATGISSSNGGSSGGVDGKRRRRGADGTHKNGRSSTPPATDVMQTSTTSRRIAPTSTTTAAVATATRTAHRSPSTAASLVAASTTDGRGAGSGKEMSRKTSFALQPAGKLARTLSWFRGRTPSQSAPTALNEEAVAAISAPTWHLPATVSLDQEQTCSLLLSHREEWDVYFITAVTAFYTHHYRTCMMTASRFLQWVETNGGGGVGASEGSRPHGRGASPPVSSPPSGRPPSVPGLQPYQQRFALFLRAWSALQIGERLQAGKDIVTLLEEREDTLGYHVGCALALYGLPLPAAKDVVLSAAPQFTNAVVRADGPGAPAPTAFSTAVQGYLYLLAEAVHAATLLQLGLVRETVAVARVALQVVEQSRLTEEDTLPLGALRDLLVIAATALEDANTVLDVPLSPHRLVYVAVCPAFFGGLSASGIRVKAQSATHRILYPQNLPLYASTRQVVPFHMNRATYLFHAGQVESAWDDACCAVAAVDEVAGSVEFAFSDCFPLRVYHFAIHVGLHLLESLLAADLKAAKACLANPTDQTAIDEKDAKLQEDELLSKEIVHICQDIVQRMQNFFPHSRVTELCRAQIAIVCGGKDYVAHAIALSRRYPHSPAAQNVLTLALYFDHHIPEAVDNARKNLQTFPHSSEVIQVHHTLQKKHVTYNFNYRKLLPIPYKPGTHDRIFTKRMIIVLLLLTANLLVLCLTVFVNVPSVTNMPNGLRDLAVRMQLPTVVPLFFAAVFVIHAIVAAVTTKNLIATLLTDLFFVNTPLNRALFCLRCIPLVNLVNALLVSVLGNNFLFESGSATFMLYFALAILFLPFTTRIWFLPSIDEPDVDFMSWLAILGVDTVVCVFVVVPHIIIAFLEPYMLVLFYFLSPTERPSSEKGFHPPSSSIRRRLLLHAHDSASMPQRFATGSGSRFIHIVLLRWLYVWSHCTMETRFLAEAQLAAECYRVFPLVDGETAEVLYTHVSQAPLCAAMAAAEEGTAAEVVRPSTDAAASQPPPPPAKAAASVGPAGDGNTAAAGRRRRHHRPSLSAASLRSVSQHSSHGGTSVPASPSPSSSSTSTTSSSSCSRSSSSSDEDGTTGGLDGTLLAGARTVDAMRHMLNRTARDRAPAMRHTASFVRPNMLHAFGASFGASGSGHAPGGGFGAGSDEDDEAEEEDVGDGGAPPDSRGRTRRAASIGNEMVHGATTRFSENIFGPNVAIHQRADDDSVSDSSSPSDADGAAYRGAAGQSGYAAAYGAAAPATEAQADAHYSYPEDYAAQNGFGWYTQNAAAGGTSSGTAHEEAHYDPDAFDF